MARAGHDRAFPLSGLTMGWCGHGLRWPKSLLTMARAGYGQGFPCTCWPRPGFIWPVMVITPADLVLVNGLSYPWPVLATAWSAH
jgi:hypothetical protein